MATAAEKRKYVADLAKKYDTNVISDNPNHKNPNQLFRDVIEKYSNYSAGNPWCASFVTAMAKMTDIALGGTPTKYNSNSSQWEGAGLYGGGNPKSAAVGLAIIWKNTPAAGKDMGAGHAGLVVGVSENKVYVMEGNTSNNLVQARDGGATRLKEYTWEKLATPVVKDGVPHRKFVSFVKLWNEEESSIGDPTKIPPYSAAGNSDIVNNGTINGATAPQGKSYADFFAEINGTLSTTEKIAELPQKETDTNKGKEKGNDFAEVKTIASPTAKLDTMSINKELETTK